MVLLKRVSGLALGLALSLGAQADPQGATVVRGSATIERDGAATTITNTPGTIINWQQFSVAPDEITRFVQQSATSAVLNRVTGSQTSEILGQLVSNGRVFLINPNGIAIGAGARINTAGFVASSLNLSDSDFVAGQERFQGSGGEGAVVNRGTIEAASGGAVYLIAPNVENHGVIRAPNGEILLAAGHSAELVAAAQPNLRVRISAPEGGEAINVGELVANAGRIGLFGATVRHSGLADASSASVNARGEIVLSATGDTYVEAGARIDASNAMGQGGRVTAVGERVAVLADAVIDASGAAGGGEIRVGGDYLGANPDVRNARATVIAPTATLDADARTSGDGGRVIIWSEEYTGFFGHVTARGGSAAGDGGFVETSSRGNLQALGSVDASAAFGTAGEWLLDPYNITIAIAGNVNGAFNGGSPNLFTPTGDNAIASRDQIVTSLNAGTSVTVSTGGVGSPGTQAGTIAVNAPIAKTAGGAATLTLNAASNISFSGSSITSTTGALNFTLNSGGSILGLPNVNLNGGVLTLNAAAASTQGAGAVISGTTSLVKEGLGSFLVTGNNTYTGATTINGGTLTLGAANRIANASAVTVAAGGTFNLAGFGETVGSLAGAGNVLLGTGTLVAGGNNTSTSFSGVISGTGAFSKTGTGTMTLLGANTYTGATTVTGGSLTLGAAERIADTSALTVSGTGIFNLNGFNETVGALTGSGALALGAGTLTTGGLNTSTTYSGVASGTGGLTKVGTGTLTLSGVNTYSGATTINTGTLTLGAANRIADASAVTVAAGATFNLNNNSDTIGSLAGAGNVLLGTGTLSAGFNNTSTIYSGVVSGMGGLIKVGTGVMTLTGANTYTGATTVNGGTLRLGAAERIADTSALTVAAAGIFDLSGFNETVGSLAGAGAVTLGAGSLTAGGSNASTTYSGIMSGTGGFTKLGTGVMTLSGANTFTGATNINAGTITLGAADRLSNSTAMTIAAGAIFNLNNFSDTIGSLAGAGNVVLGMGTLSAGLDNTSTAYSGVISGTGGFSKVGSGTMTLSGANTYTGTTTVAGGTLTLGAANRIADTSALNVLAGGTFNLNSFAETLASIAGAGNIDLGAAPAGGLTAGGSNASTTFSGVMSGGGAFTKVGSGVLTMSGANTLSGAINVNVGTLVVANAAALGSTAAGTTVANGATLRVSNAAVGAEPVSLLGNGVGGAGALTGDGVASIAGPITLTGASRFGTTNAASILTVGGTVNGAFALNIAGAGTVALNGLVGNLVPLASITQTAAPLRFGGGPIVTTGLQSYTGPVTLTADTTLTSTANGALTLSNVAGGGFDLTANTGGATTLSGITGVDALTTDAAGTVALSGTISANSLSINEATPIACGTLGSGAGNVSFAGAVTLCGNTTVSGTGVTFGSTVNSDATARTLTVNASGATNFVGAVGGTNALASLTTDAAGTTRFQGGGAATAPVRTTGAQTYNDAVELVAASAGQIRQFVSTGGGAINFASTVNSSGAAAALAVNTSGATTFGGAIGGILALDSVTTDAPGTLAVNGGLVRTNGVQTYNDAMTLGGATTLRTLAGGNVTAAGAVNGTAGTLTLDLGAGTASLANAANDFSVVAITSAAGTTLVDSNALVIGGANVAGTLNVAAGGALTQTSAITAATLIADTRNDAGAAITLTDAANDVDVLALRARNAANTAPAAGAISYVDADDLTIQALQSTAPAAVTATGTLTVNSDVRADTLTLRSSGSDVVLSAGRVLTANGGGSAIVIDAAAAFVNNGATLVPGTGRWVIYSADPALNTFGGLASGQAPIWGATSATLAPAAVPAGNRYVFGTGQTLTFTSTDATKVYGDDATALVAGSYVVSGFNTNTYGGAFLADDASTTFTGTPLVTSLGSPVTAGVAGSPYTIDVAAGSVVATNGYTLVFNSAGQLTVTPLGITVVANDATKVYGDADPLLTYVATGLINGDTLSGSLVRDPGETVLGGPYAINQGTLGNPNYTIAYTAGQFTITPRGITVVANDATKVYGDADPLLTYVATGLIGGDTLSGSLVRDPGETVAGSPYAINQGTLGNPNYTIAYTAGQFTITPRGITVVANDATKVYGDADPLLTYVATGLIGGDTLSGSLVRDPGETVAGSPYTINQGTLGNPNYTIAYTAGQFTITPRPITVVANDATKVYGDADPLLTYVATGLIGGDTLSGSLVRDPGETVAGSPYTINQGTLGNPNYTIAYTAGQFTITPRPITVVANDATKVYGDADPLLTYVATGLIGGDTLSGSLVRDPGETVLGGPYAINQGTLGNPNYSIAYTPGVFTITPRGITVVANDLSKIYGDADPLLTYVATGLIGGDTLSGSLVRDPGETVAGSPYTINQGTLANSNYTIAYTAGQFTITPRGITVVANDATKVYGDADPLLTYVATGLIGGDTLSGSLVRAPGETVLGGPYAINQGTLGNPNYSIAYTPGVFTITPRGITVVANDLSKIYGDADPLLTYVATGLIGGDTLSGSLVRVPGESVAGSPYAINQGTLANSNYTIAYTAGAFTITRRPITVVADDLTKDFGQADPPLTYTTTNLVAGDTLSGSLVRAPGETPRNSPYLISQGTVTDLNNPNYLIAFTPGYLTIIPGAVSPENPALQLALIQTAADPFVSACLPIPEGDILGKEFAAAQQRLDRAGGNIRISSGPVCRATPL